MRAAVVAAVAGMWALSGLGSPVPQRLAEAAAVAVVGVALAPRVWAWTAGSAS